MADLVDRTVVSADPLNEAVATTGLFLILTAIIAVAFALASWGSSDTLIAAVAGGVALLSFAASILCFKAQAVEPAAAEVTLG